MNHCLTQNLSTLLIFHPAEGIEMNVTSRFVTLELKIWYEMIDYDSLAGIVCMGNLVQILRKGCLILGDCGRVGPVF